jgi:hypothetical protein
VSSRGYGVYVIGLYRYLAIDLGRVSVRPILNSQVATLGRGQLEGEEVNHILNTKS